MKRPENKGTFVSCKNLECPVNVSGACGPAAVRLKHERRIDIIKELPLWKRILFAPWLKHKTKRQTERDHDSLMDYAMKKNPVAVLWAKMMGLEFK